MGVTEEQVRHALRAVKYPGFTRDIVSFGLVKEVQITEDDVAVQLVITTNDATVPRTIKAEIEAVLRAVPGVREVKVLVDIHAPAASGGQSGVGATRIAGVKHVVAIASGKGGVG